MSILTPVCLLLIFLAVGWFALSFARIEDNTIRMLLAPATGIAVVILIITTGSVAGLPINKSALFVLVLFIFSTFSFLNLSLIELKSLFLLPLFVILLNLFTVGLGLILYGTAWQGLVNGDAPTNSLAAAYFSSNSFFSTPNITSIIDGSDFSPLSSMLFVSGGSRFGDVMLLGFSATVFALNPDEVYMSHALALRCALICVSLLFIYESNQPKWKLVLTIVSMTLAPLGVYTYLNQLISQLTGMILVTAGAFLLREYLDKPNNKNTLILIAIVTSALLQSYPESVSMFVCVVFFYAIQRATNFILPSLKQLFSASLFIILLVILFLNFTIANVFTHMFAALGSVVQKSSDSLSVGEHGYAFTSDAFSLLFGLIVTREALFEPWAFIITLFSFIIAFKIFIYLFKNYNKYPLLFVFFAVELLAFSILFNQRSGFGTFKMMLMAQPIVSISLALLLIYAIQESKSLSIIFSIIAYLLIGRSTVTYFQKSISTYGPIAFLAQNNLLAKMDFMIEKSRNHIMIDSPGLLFGYFEVLRPKRHAVTFAQNFPAFYASPELKLQTKNKLSIFRPNQDTFADNLSNYFINNYKNSQFKCHPSLKNIQFSEYKNISDEKIIDYLLPGGKITTLNRYLYPNDDLLLLSKINTQDFLVFRSSSIGGYYGGPISEISLFYLENDPFTISGMSGVGRYMLLEILGQSSDEIQLNIKLSRSFMGGQNTQLPELSIYGHTEAKIPTGGSGALNLVSPPVQPCVIDGRRYVLIDFGLKATKFLKTAPWSYQFFHHEYSPDTRNLTAFLRDISVVNNRFTSQIINAENPLLDSWNFQKFDSMFEYSGIYEDGWVSNLLTLKLKDKKIYRKINITMDIPLDLANKNSLLKIVVNGKPIKLKPMLAGRSVLTIDLLKVPSSLIQLAVDNPLVLQNGDGRTVMGLIKSINLE